MRTLGFILAILAYLVVVPPAPAADAQAPSPEDGTRFFPLILTLSANVQAIAQARRNGTNDDLEAVRPNLNSLMEIHAQALTMRPSPADEALRQAVVAMTGPLADASRLILDGLERGNRELVDLGFERFVEGLPERGQALAQAIRDLRPTAPVVAEEPAPALAPTPSATPVPGPLATPSWVPSRYCQHASSIEYDCGTVQYIPLGQTARIAVHRIACTYPSIHVGCGTLPSKQTIDVTVLEVERNARGEQTTDPREEPVLLRVRVRYVDGPLGERYDGYAVPYITHGWLTGNLADGRSLYFPSRRPHLSGLDYGQEQEGWIGGYLPAGAEFVMVTRSGEHDYVFFGTS